MGIGEGQLLELFEAAASVVVCVITGVYRIYWFHFLDVERRCFRVLLFDGVVFCRLGLVLEFVLPVGTGGFGLW